MRDLSEWDRAPYDDPQTYADTINLEDAVNPEMTDVRAARSLLLQYSEWLDTERIDLRDKADPRTHEDLINQFIASRNVYTYPQLEERATV